MLKNSSFFVCQGNSVFSMIEQAELNRAFWKAWRAKPSQAFLPKSLSQKQTEPSLGSNPTLNTWYSKSVLLGTAVMNNMDILKFLTS